ncbi:MAG: M15 family metallopeptidase [Actinomycetota bacterium]|nr:M15 family metallopeptidase [Actinomycetota bacterium]
MVSVVRRGLLAAMVLVSACSLTGGGSASSTTSTAPTTSTSLATTTTATTSTIPATTTTVNPFARPAWMGTRVLPLRADGYGEVQPTPAEFDPRALETPDVFLPPSDEHFRSRVGPIPTDVLARSSWVPECPVALDELSYLVVSHYGFDGRFHNGEMIVNAEFANEVVEVFRLMHEARFPIEEMRVITKEEIDAPPTGDWNDTTSFVCRPAVGSNSWSQHAFGLAIDVNPFHNPYLKGDLVLPELASTYTDREDVRPGMIFAGDVVTEAFSEMGWGWGGNWSSLKDWMHFSFTGR